MWYHTIHTPTRGAQNIVTNDFISFKSVNQSDNKSDDPPFLTTTSTPRIWAQRRGTNAKINSHERPYKSVNQSYGRSAIYLLCWSRGAQNSLDQLYTLQIREPFLQPLCNLHTTDLTIHLFLPPADDPTYPGATAWFNCSLDAWCNSSGNASLANSTDTDVQTVVVMAVTSVVLAIIILATIIGEFYFFYIIL